MTTCQHPRPFFAARITKTNLDRMLWLFDDHRPRLPFAGRTKTRFQPSEKIDGQILDDDGCVEVAFGRYHRFVRTTNGATIDIQVSVPVLRRLDPRDIVYLQCFKGALPKHFHFVATSYRGQLEAEEFQMFRFDNSICLQFGSGSRQRQFRIWKSDISTGKYHSPAHNDVPEYRPGPVDILWGDADRYRYDRIIVNKVGTSSYRDEFLAAGGSAQYK